MCNTLLEGLSQAGGQLGGVLPGAAAVRAEVAAVGVLEAGVVGDPLAGGVDAKGRAELA